MRIPKQLAVTVLLCASASLATPACTEQNPPRPDAHVADAHDVTTDAPRIADGSDGSGARDAGVDASQPIDARPIDAPSDAPIA
jgi:hypothetical protein|nr:hypothetical protein [Kofleriaceae bacterium]